MIPISPIGDLGIFYTFVIVKLNNDNIKIFKEHVGVTPKVFLKIIRFQKALQEIETHKTVNWTSIAFESGYYDQAHFINDFKEFSGFTPNQYLKMQSDFANYIAVG